MKTNKNIDRLFQEKFKDFEVSPPDNVWNGIERNLKTNKPKLRFPLWLRIGSVAAVLMLLTVGGVNYFNSEPSDNNNPIVSDSDNENTPRINENLLKKDLLNSSENENTFTKAENDENKNDITSKTTLSNKKQGANKQLINSKRNQQKNIQNTVVTVQFKKSENILDTEIATNDNSFKRGITLSNKNSNTKNASNNNVATTTNNVNSKNNSVNDDGYSTSSDKVVQNNAKESVNKNLTEPKNKSLDAQVDFDKTNEEENTVAQVETEKIESLEDNLTKNVEEETEENIKKWSVASVVASIAYNSFNAKGSPLDLQFENSPKQGSKTMSYGVKVGYKLNKKLSLQSGITLINVGYKIGDVFINPSQESLQKLTNVNYSSEADILNIQVGNFLNNVQLETTSPVPVKGILNQEFGYIEIPLELKYKLNNSQKLGINLVGGLSTLFLNKNEISVETSEFSSNLGEANNLNNINFSGNLGIDIDYKINKSLYFNVAPMLKIHTSTFSKNADNFKPYIFGVYTGLNYKF